MEREANNAHYEVGREIRTTIEKQRGTLPEDFSTPDKSLKELKNYVVKGNYTWR